MNSYTLKNLQMFEAIKAIWQEQGYAPSVRQLGKRLGLSSPSTVHSHLRKLENLGYIKHDPTIPRSIVIVREPV